MTGELRQGSNSRRMLMPGFKIRQGWWVKRQDSFTQFYPG